MTKVNYEKIWKQFKKNTQDQYRELLEFPGFSCYSTLNSINEGINQLEDEMAEMDIMDGTNDKEVFTQKLHDEGVYDFHLKNIKDFKKEKEERDGYIRKEDKNFFTSWLWTNQETGGKESYRGVIEKAIKRAEEEEKKDKKVGNLISRLLSMSDKEKFDYVTREKEKMIDNYYDNKVQPVKNQISYFYVDIYFSLKEIEHYVADEDKKKQLTNELKEQLKLVTK